MRKLFLAISFPLAAGCAGLTVNEYSTPNTLPDFEVVTAKDAAKAFNIGYIEGKPKDTKCTTWQAWSPSLSSSSAESLKSSDWSAHRERAYQEIFGSQNQRWVMKNTVGKRAFLQSIESKHEAEYHCLKTGTFSGHSCLASVVVVIWTDSARYHGPECEEMNKLPPELE